MPRRSERARKTCELRISTADYYFGSDSLEVGNSFVESEDFCWANDWGVSSVSGGVGGKLEWVEWGEACHVEVDDGSRESATYK